MYSREKRIKAVELWLKYDRCTTDVINELGYPSNKMLSRWYKEYLQEQESGIKRARYCRASKYTPEQQRTAVEYYLEHGKSMQARTLRRIRGGMSQEISGHVSRTALRLDFRKKGWNNASFYGTGISYLISRGRNNAQLAAPDGVAFYRDFSQLSANERETKNHLLCGWRAL